MNYLAHAYLSFGNEPVLVGNMISDFVKGKKQYDYPEAIRNGILLHRSIDTFTDDHPALKEAKEIFRPAYRLYAGAIVDVVLDYYLATDDEEFTGKSLFNFSLQVYGSLDRYTQWMPAYFAGMFGYMKKDNWLYHYREKQGIEKSLQGLVRRAAYMNDSHAAIELFYQHDQLLQNCYRQFWAEIKSHARRQYILLTGETG